jgi:hypothetical protein
LVGEDDGYVDGSTEGLAEGIILGFGDGEAVGAECDSKSLAYNENEVLGKLHGPVFTPAEADTSTDKEPPNSGRT